MNEFMKETSDFFMGLAKSCEATGTWIVLTLIFAGVILLGEYLEDLTQENTQKIKKFSWEDVDKGRLIRASILAFVISAILAKIILFVLTIILAVCSGLPYFFGGLLLIFAFLLIAGVIVIVI